MRVLEVVILLLFLQRFFIGYWILKTGLDVYPGPFFYALYFATWQILLMPHLHCSRFIHAVSR